MKITDNIPYLFGKAAIRQPSAEVVSVWPIARPQSNQRLRKPLTDFYES